MRNRNWNDFETYAKSIFFSQTKIYFFDYIQRRAFSSMSKSSFFEEKDKVFLSNKFWDINKDIEKYYNIFEFVLFDEEKHQPSIVENIYCIDSENVNEYLDIINNISFKLPDNKNKIILDGDTNEIKFGNDVYAKLSITWQGEIPTIFKDIEKIISFLNKLTGMRL